MKRAVKDPMTTGLNLDNLAAAVKQSTRPERSGRRSPPQELANDPIDLNQSGEWAQQSIEDSIFSRDNLMKSNFKLAQNKNTEDDELFSPQDHVNLKSSRELVQSQKLAHLSPSTAYRQ